MGIAEAVRPVQAMGARELSQQMANQMKTLSWGTPDAEADNRITVTIQLRNVLDQDVAASEIVRLTCDEGATMSLKSGGNGTVLSGDDTEDIIVQFDETTGTFDLEVTYADAGTITVLAGQTQGTGHVMCNQYAELTFA